MAGAAISAGEQSRLHRRGDADDGQQPAAGIQALLEAFGEYRHRTGEHDDIVRTVFVPAACGVAAFQRDIGDAVRRQAR